MRDDITMKIRAQLHCMAANEIEKMIPADIMADIKRRDPNPLFKAFVVGHEGEARGNLVGIGNVVKKWFRSMVKKLFDKIQIGLELFHGHGTTNDHAGRLPIGKVVAKSIQDNEWSGLEVIAICYIDQDYRHLPLDVASIEADVNMEYETGANLMVTDVVDVSGIALGNSKLETPGFPGATLLGQLQAMAEKQSLKITLFEGDNMTLAELKQAIQESKLQPSDLFGQEAIFADPAIKEQVQEKISNAKGYDYRKFETLTEKKVELEQKLKDAEAKIETSEQEKQTLKLESAKTKVGSLFDTQKTERKLDEKQVKYIQKRLGGFTPQKVEDLEKEFNTFLDDQIKDFKADAEVFGIEVKAPPDPNRVGNGGTGPEGGKPGGVDAGSKYLDPAQNPMIKTDAV